MRHIFVSIFIICVCICKNCYSDVYMHNPRGSNDRNCERNVNRNNDNRLFNSQNNAAGGYACPRAVGDETMQNEMGDATFYDIDTSTGETTSFTQNKRMYYYSGSILPIEWTGQHGCGGNSKVSCEIIIQYACEDTLDPQIDNFWPWVTDKAENTTTYYGKQHFRDLVGNNIAAPRDGVPISTADAATDTINDIVTDAVPNTPTTRRYGMQESFDYYQVCQRTERNKGLYTADQVVNRNDRRGTRQNPQGNRYGFECPEERDYYPYWAPSPWIDVAVLTDSGSSTDICYKDSTVCTKRCNYYMNNTMNWNNKGYCDVDHSNKASTVATKVSNRMWQSNQWYNNQPACVAAGFKWYEVSHDDNIELQDTSFVCAKTQFSRVNQLGNGRNDDIASQNMETSTGILADHIVSGVNANRFLWTIPKIPTIKKSTYFDDMTSAYKSCVLRVRYNISSADFQSWPYDAVDADTDSMVDNRNNSVSDTAATTPLHQDPYVYIGPGDLSSSGDKFVSLAVNTNQYSRTFQDRSYVFSIKPLPTASAAANTQTDTPQVNYASMAKAIANGGYIYNVNVRGKRGNIVEVYPSVEYDFIPNALALSTNDMIHFQWTGSDYNPQRGCNDGEGGPPDLNTYSTAANANQNTRADRSNIVLTSHMANNVPKDYLGYDQNDNTLSYNNKKSTAMATVLKTVPCYDPSSSNSTVAAECYDSIMRMAFLNQQLDGGSTILRDGLKCLTQTEIEALAVTDANTAQFHPLNCAKLNAKPYPYFDAGVVFMRKVGWYPFFSSRNNNFSNRQQIGIICVGNSNTDCPIDKATGVLQDQNPLTNGVSLTPSLTVKSNRGAGAKAAGTLITGETFASSDRDNDLSGTGNMYSCRANSNIESITKIEKQVGLAVGLLFVGLFLSWAMYYSYNRYYSHGDSNKFRHDKTWTDKDSSDLTASDGRLSHKKKKSIYTSNENPMVTAASGITCDGTSSTITSGRSQLEIESNSMTSI